MQNKVEYLKKKKRKKKKEKIIRRICYYTNKACSVEYDWMYFFGTWD